MGSVQHRSGTGASTHHGAMLPSAPLVVQILLRMFNAMNCGAVLLGGNKRVLHLNAKAENYLGDGLMVTNDRLCALDRGCDAILQTVLDQSLKYRQMHRTFRLRDAVGLKRFEKPSLIVRIVPVFGEAQAELDGATVVLILVDPLDCPEPSHDILEQVFGLTKSEARVASRLMCGASLQQIADNTGVTVGTVRTQMKSVFAKTHTHRQAELVALLMRLAMISEGGDSD